MYLNGKLLLNLPDQFRSPDRWFLGAHMLHERQDFGGELVGPFGAPALRNESRQALSSKIRLRFVKRRTRETEAGSDTADRRRFFPNAAQHFVFDLRQILRVEKALFEKQAVLHFRGSAVESPAFAQSLYLGSRSFD